MLLRSEGECGRVMEEEAAAAGGRSGGRGGGGGSRQQRATAPTSEGGTVRPADYCGFVNETELQCRLATSVAEQVLLSY